MLRQQGFLDRVKRSADASNTMQQLRLVSNCVSHRVPLLKIRDTPTGYLVKRVDPLSVDPEKTRCSFLWWQPCRLQSISEANARHYSFARRRHSPRNDMSINSAPNVQTIAAPDGRSHQKERNRPAIPPSQHCPTRPDSAPHRLTLIRTLQ